MANIVSTTNKLHDYKEAVVAFLALNPTTTPALLKVELEAQDDAFKEARHTQIVDFLSSTPGLQGSTGGVVEPTVTVDTAGTGYVIGDTFAITGGAGKLGGVKVTSIGGSGEILTMELTNAGVEYTTPVADLSGSGDGAGAITLTATAVTGKDQGKLLSDMLLETYP